MKESENTPEQSSAIHSTAGLERCPFCGGEAWIADMAGYEAGCKKCGALSPSANAETGEPIVNKQDCIDAWNKRSNLTGEALPTTDKEI